jgi:hypothetical protein
MNFLDHILKKVITDMSGTIVSFTNKGEFSQSKHLIDMGIKTCDSCGTITCLEQINCKKCGQIILIINE